MAWGGPRPLRLGEHGLEHRLGPIETLGVLGRPARVPEGPPAPRQVAQHRRDPARGPPAGGLGGLQAGRVSGHEGDEAPRRLRLQPGAFAGAPARLPGSDRGRQRTSRPGCPPGGPGEVQQRPHRVRARILFRQRGRLLQPPLALQDLAGQEQGPAQQPPGLGRRLPCEIGPAEHPLVDSGGAVATASGHIGLTEQEQAGGGHEPAGQVGGALQALDGGAHRSSPQGGPAGLDEDGHGVGVARQATPQRLLHRLLLQAPVAQQPEGPGVQLVPQQRVEVLVERLPEQRVRELGHARAGRPDQAAPAEGVEHRFHLDLIEPRQFGRHVGPEGPAQRAGGAGEGQPRFGKVCESAKEKGPGDGAGGGCGIVGVLRRRLSTEVQRHQLQQQRVAPAGLAGLHQQLGRRPAAEAHGEDLGGRLGTQRVEAIHRRVGRLGQGEGHLLGPGRPRPQGGHHRHGHLGQSPAQERQQRQRVGIGPVQVVEGEQHRRAIGRLAQPSEDFVEPRRPHFVGRPVPRLVTEERTATEVVDDLGHQPEGQCRLHGVAPSQPHPAVDDPELAGVLEDSGLAHPRVGDDEEAPTTSSPGAIEELLDGPDHTIALQHGVLEATRLQPNGPGPAPVGGRSAVVDHVVVAHVLLLPHQRPHVVRHQLVALPGGAQLQGQIQVVQVLRLGAAPAEADHRVILPVFGAVPLASVDYLSCQAGSTSWRHGGRRPPW